MVEELEEKVLHSGEEVFNAEEVRRRNLERMTKKQPRKKGQVTARRGRKKRSMEEEDDEEEMEEERPNTNTISRNRPQRHKKMRIIQESDENGDD